MPIERFQGGDEGLRRKLNQLVDAVNTLSDIKGDNQFIGVTRSGGATVRLMIDAVLARIPKPSATSLFLVKVTKDGGSNGNKTTAATWTYTVKNLAGSTIGTTVALTRPRPYGTATYQAADSYGIAFYDGATLKLWDAGEIYGTGGCA